MTPRLKRRLLVSLLAVVVTAWLVDERLSRGQGSTYQGKTTSQWARALQDWRLVGEPSTNKRRGPTFWMREPSLLEKVREKLGGPAVFDTDLPLLRGDAEAVGVLIELLEYQDRKVRSVALQGLKEVGRPAKAAVPVLLKALDDE